MRNLFAADIQRLPMSRKQRYAASAAAAKIARTQNDS